VGHQKRDDRKNRQKKDSEIRIRKKSGENGQMTTTTAVRRQKGIGPRTEKKRAHGNQPVTGKSKKNQKKAAIKRTEGNPKQ